MKKLLIVVFALAVVMTLATVVLATEAKAADITVSFVKSRDPFDTTTTLDKVAHADGKVVVAKGTEITIPNAADISNFGTEGYQLIWYTENGRTYMPGDKVAFTEDTRLYRCLAKEVYEASELSTALKGNTAAAILMADIKVTSRVGVKGQDQSVLVMNKHTLEISVNDNGIGDQRSGKHIVGEGTINITSPNNSSGQYSVFEAKSHGHNGHMNKQTVGVDVTINAPKHNLMNDSDASWVSGYPWVKVYGKINVYSLGKVTNTNRSPRVEIFEGAEITLTGPLMFQDGMNTQCVQITIYGGTFNLPSAAQYPGYWSNDVYDANAHGSTQPKELTVGTADKISILGGTFNYAIPEVAMRNGNYVAIYDEAQGVYTVAKSTCTGGTHNYTIAEAYGDKERTCVNDGLHYFRCNCGASIVQAVEAFGHSYTIIEIEVEATTSQNGTKRVTCDRCGDTYTYNYSMSPLELEIIVTIATQDGTQDVTVLAGEFFDMTEEETLEGFSYTINSIKESADFTKDNVVKVQIPAGVISVSAGVFKDMTALKEITLLERSDTTFMTSSFNNCPSLEKIIAIGCTPIFQRDVTTKCPNLATIDVRLANGIFEAYAFDMETGIKELLLGEGMSYTFYEAAFHGTGLTSMEFVDNARVTFAAKKAFAECLSLEYIYIGSNCVVGGVLPDEYSLFDGNSNLKVVVIMDLTYLGKWSFSGKAPGAQFGPLCDLEVYCHSKTISYHNEAFNNRKSEYHVFFYTVDANAKKTGISNCNITIFNGIPHAYKESVIIESTCVTQGTYGYATTCPCGVDYRDSEYISYSSYDNDMKNVTHEPYGTEVSALPLSTEHKVSNIVVNVNYAIGMTENGFKIYKCMHCDVEAAQEEVATFAPIFVDYGYSVSTFGKISVSQCYGLERSVYNEYLEITGNEIVYGVAVAVKATVSDGKLINADGSANQNVLSYSCVSAKYDMFDVRVVGLERREDAEIYFCGYYIVNGKVYYIDNGLSNLEEPNATSYNKIVELVKLDAE